MELKKITLNNFKCFSDQELKLSKLTLLLGANSTGKSSLIYSLLATLQSDQFPIILSPNGSLVTLGDFKSISNMHQLNNKINIGLEFQQSNLGPIIYEGTFSYNSKTELPKLESARLENNAIKIEVVQSNNRYKANWFYDSSKNTLQNETDFNRFKKILKVIDEINKEVKKANQNDNEKSKEDIEDMFAPPPSSGNFSFKSPANFFNRLNAPNYFELTPYLSPLLDGLTGFRRMFNYIGSFRLEPQRSYYQVTKGDLKVLRDGTNYIEQLTAWEEKHSPELKRLISALRQLKLLSNLRIKRLKGGSFEVNVKTPSNSVPVSIADVGFGIGQLLPILVADLQLPNGGTLAISQPEIHLHPSVQADLAEYFVNRANSKKINYIIETHSEYFFNRIRLLISKGKIKSEDVSVLYLSMDDSTLRPHILKFEPDGRIDGAPIDFFQTYLLDTLNIAMVGTE